MKLGFSAKLSSWHISSFLPVSDTFLSFIFYKWTHERFLIYNSLKTTSLKWQKLQWRGPTLLGIIKLICRLPESAYAFSSLNQFTMMNGLHLASQLVLCWAVSLCLSLFLWSESCFQPGSRWVTCRRKIKGKRKVKNFPYTTLTAWVRSGNVKTSCCTEDKQ